MKRGYNNLLTAQQADLNLPQSGIEIRIDKKPTLPAKKSEVKHTSVEFEMISEDMDEKPPQTKIYVYLQLKGIQNIPILNGDIEIRLQQGDEEIPRLDKECTPCRLMATNCNVTFSFPVYQDSIDSLNLISDKPILITLFDIIRRNSLNSEMEEDIYEDMVPIGQGHIDILGYFREKRFSVTVETFIYPTNKNTSEYGTAIATFQIYTLLPLLKNLNYSNLIFISFESLYNCTEDILDDPEDLIADIVFRSASANSQGKEDMVQICSFTGFKKSIIKNQNPNIIWESAKVVEQSTGTSFGFYSNSMLNVSKLFKRVLRPEGKPLDFNTIDVEKNEALVCNGVHRYVLTEELRTILEEVFLFGLQGLVVRVYRNGAPDEILLEGPVEPSVFLYPYVNAVRMAVVLQPPQKNVPTKRRKSKKDSLASGDMARQYCFGIISICLLAPITEAIEVQKKDKFSRLSDKTILQSDKLIERAYDSFDNWVAEVVDYIVKNNIREIDDAKNFFCCQTQNAQNRILELIALDFNKRFPTKNNIEFCNLMTTVYKELENRVHKTVEACGKKQLKDCRISGKTIQNDIIELMNSMKLANELQDESLSKLILDELNEHYSKNIDFNFYMFLDSVENGNFIAAKRYIENPSKDRKLKDEYYTCILNSYIQYMENLQFEKIYNEAFERLIGNLNGILKKFPNDPDCWILLYCMYKSSEYLPGMEFTRWHYEDLDPASRRILDDIPNPRWQFYLNYDLGIQSKRNREFYKTVKMFQSIGAYKFAEMVFNHITAECTDIERYMQKTTLKILLKEVRPNSSPREFEDLSTEMETELEHVNGNLLYACDDIDLANEHYEKVIELVENTEGIESYKLGLWRHAIYMMSEEKYWKAIRALTVLDKDKKSIAVSFTMGRANYKLGRLREALECFKECTEHNLFIPDVWGYLALIHLKLGENYNALECWKYAKHIPNMVISEEIIDELNKINMDEVDLFVDKPC